MHETIETRESTSNAYSEEKTRMIRHLRATLKHYKNMLDFFEPVIARRDAYKNTLYRNQYIKPEKETIHSLRNQEGFPMLIKDDVHLDQPMISNYFLELLDIMNAQSAGKTDLIEKLIHDRDKFCFSDLIDQNFNQSQYIPDIALLEFLIDETLGPVLEVYSENLKDRVKNNWEKNFCPVCGKKPAFALLKADDGKKLLVCSLCSFQWEFTRLKCPHCGNENQKLLSYFVVEDDDMYRIEICDACGCYLKTINLKNVSHEIFFNIESIITLHLDIIARDKGYSSTYMPDASGAKDCLRKYA